MSCKVHNVRFYTPKPRAVLSLSVHKTEKKLAVLRRDQTIEIWNLSSAPFIEKTINPNITQREAECVIWSDDRLFSCTRDAFILEYDLRSLSVAKTVTLTGGAAYCMDINPINQNLAVGTEKGYINIFATDDNELIFSKFLDKQEGQILCLKYDPSGKYIASGSIDLIRVWDVLTGHALHKMTTGRSDANKMTIVWTIQITGDLTVISGDSRGKLTFWDGKQGIQIESYQSHKADLLASCLSKDEKTLYCAGVDPNITSYEKIQIKDQKSKWVKSIQRKVHEHDVKALVLIKNKLYSAGEDGYLACSFYPPKTLIKYAPIITNPIEICEKNKLIMMKEPYSVDIWTLGHENLKEKVENRPQRLLLLTKSHKSGIKEAYNFACLSQDGQFIACGTNVEVIVYKFNLEACLKGDRKAIKRIPASTNLPLSNKGVFTAKNELILSPKTGGLLICKVDEENIEIQQELDTKILKDTITHLIVSKCNNYFVVGDPLSNIAVFKRNKQNFSFYCSLPKYNYSPTTMSFNTQTKCLVVAYCDGRLAEFSLQKQKFSAFNKHLDHNSLKKLAKNYPIQNIIFDERQADVIVFQDDSSIVSIDRNVKILDSKMPKLEIGDCETSSIGAFTILKKYKHLVHLGWLNKEELVAVEVSPLSLSQQLPPCLEQNTFGTK